MRRSLPAVLLLSIAAVLAACSSSTSPGWTYAPPTEAPASQPAPSADASAAPSAEAPSGEAPSDGGEAGEVVTVTAKGVQFLEKELTGPADTPFIIRFDNQDPGVPHDVVIRGDGGQDLFKGEIFNGVEVRDYQVPAIPAGTYQFLCSVHPNMVGTITLGS